MSRETKRRETIALKYIYVSFWDVASVDWIDHPECNVQKRVRLKGKQGKHHVTDRNIGRWKGEWLMPISKKVVID